MRSVIFILLTFSLAPAQSPQEKDKKADQNPPVKVNVLNVCTPSADDQRELRAALGRLPKAPGFALDYEISHGIATAEDGKNAKYVRLRRDLKSDSPLATIQYSLSLDPASTIETLVFRGRDVKELLALSIEDKLSTSVSRPATVIESDTPASRIRVERLGKTTLALTRCEGVDQSQYDPIFAEASAVLADYRRVLRLPTMLASDIAWLNSTSNSSARKGSPNASQPAAPPRQDNPR